MACRHAFFCCLVVHETSNVWKECASLQAQRLRVTVRRPTYPVPMAKWFKFHVVTPKAESKILLRFLLPWDAVWKGTNKKPTWSVWLCKGGASTDSDFDGKSIEACWVVFLKTQLEIPLENLLADGNLVMFFFPSFLHWSVWHLHKSLRLNIPKHVNKKNRQLCVSIPEATKFSDHCWRLLEEGGLQAFHGPVGCILMVKQRRGSGF